MLPRSGPQPISGAGKTRGRRARTAVATRSRVSRNSRTKPVNSLHKVSDEALVTANQAVKMVLREVWHLGGQIVNGAAATVMELTVRPGYDASRRGRYVDPAAASAQSSARWAAATEMTAADFTATLREGVEAAAARVDALVAHLHSKEGPLSAEARREVERRLPAPGAARAWARAGLERVVSVFALVFPAGTRRLRRVQNSALDLRGPGTPRLAPVAANNFSSDDGAEKVQRALVPSFSTTAAAAPGLFEEAELGAMMLVDKATTAARGLLDSIFRMDFAVGPSQYLHRLSSVRSSLLARRLRQELQPAVAPTAVASARPSTNLVLNCRRLVELECGLPLEVHKVTTLDGYILTLLRIPRPDATRAVFLQHGLLDTALGWISNGADNSLAPRAYEAGYDVFIGNFRCNDAHQLQSPSKKKKASGMTATEARRHRAFLDADRVAVSDAEPLQSRRPAHPHSGYASTGGGESDAHSISDQSSFGCQRARFLASTARRAMEACEHRHEWLTPRDDEFWTFSVDDHSLDVSACVAAVRAIKAREGPGRHERAVVAEEEEWADAVVAASTVVDGAPSVASAPPVPASELDVPAAGLEQSGPAPSSPGRAGTVARRRRADAPHQRSRAPPPDKRGELRRLNKPLALPGGYESDIPKGTPREVASGGVCVVAQLKGHGDTGHFDSRFKSPATATKSASPSDRDSGGSDPVEAASATASPVLSSHAAATPGHDHDRSLPEQGSHTRSPPGVGRVSGTDGASASSPLRPPRLVLQRPGGRWTRDVEGGDDSRGGTQRPRSPPRVGDRGSGDSGAPAPTAHEHAPFASPYRRRLSRSGSLDAGPVPAAGGAARPDPAGVASQHRQRRRDALRPVTVVGVGHSMGGCALLMYVVHCADQERPTGLDKAVLLAPAGQHHVLPVSTGIFARVVMALFDVTRPRDGQSFPMGGSTAQLAVAKLLQDMKSTPATAELLNSMVAFLIGGEAQSSPFRSVHLTDYPLGVTSIKVMKHGLHCVRHAQFLAADHGSPEANMLRYGTPSTPGYLARFPLIDIPLHFVAGGKDMLIPPENVKRMFEALRGHRPDLASYRNFPEAGHLDFTIGDNDEILTHIMSHLRCRPHRERAPRRQQGRTARPHSETSDVEWHPVSASSARRAASRTQLESPSQPSGPDSPQEGSGHLLASVGRHMSAQLRERLAAGRQVAEQARERLLAVTESMVEGAEGEVDKFASSGEEEGDDDGISLVENPGDGEGVLAGSNWLAAARSQGLRRALVTAMSWFDRDADDIPVRTDLDSNALREKALRARNPGDVQWGYSKLGPDLAPLPSWRRQCELFGRDVQPGVGQ